MTILEMPRIPSGQNVAPKLLKLHFDLDCMAAEFLRRLISSVKGARPACPQDCLIPIPDGNIPIPTWPARAPRPALVTLTDHLVVLHFHDNSALVALSGPDRDLRPVPLVLQASPITRGASGDVPLSWAVTYDPDRGAACSSLRARRSMRRGTDLSTGVSLDDGIAVPRERIRAFLNDLEGEARAWAREYTERGREDPDAWPAVYVDAITCLTKEEEASAQVWLGELCTVLSGDVPALGRVGITIAARHPRQCLNTDLLDLVVLLNGAMPGEAISRSLEERAREILQHPSCPWGLHRLVRMKTPADGRVQISRPQEIQLFGLGAANLSHHERLRLHAKIGIFSEK